MPTFGRYRVYLLDYAGSKVAQLFPGDDFLGITWEHLLNEPGAYRCELVAETATKDRFHPHYQVLIERNWSDDPANWYEEFVGFHLGEHKRWITSEVDEAYWASLGLSPEWLLTQPLLQPVANVANDNWAYYDLWWGSEPADDLLKAMVAESLSDPAEADRQYAYVSAAGKAGAGVWLCYEGNWDRLHDAMVDAVGEDGGRGGCDFRMARLPGGGYQFQTYAPIYGVDRRRGNPDGRKPTIFSHDNGNIVDLEHTVIWAEAVTAAYGGWQGGGMERAIYLEESVPARLTGSPYARREAFYDVRDVTSPDSIPSWLQQKLIEDGEVDLVTGKILQTDACLYGRDWAFGDLVTVDLPDGSSHDARVVNASGSIDGEHEERIEGVVETWTRTVVVT